MTKKKFKPGRKVKTMGELSLILGRGQWIFIRHKAYHYGWTMSLSWKYLNDSVKLGWVRRAVKL